MKSFLFSYLIIIPWLINLNAANASIMTCQESPAATVFVPFELEIDPMERLLLINIENDPDSIYIGFEPQVFDDDINGRGMLIIGWRFDGRVDVYHQPGLKPDPYKFNIAGKGLAHIAERLLEGAFLEINDQGAQTWFSFADVYDRPIEISLSESHPAKRRPFGLLAPMGHATENPRGLPLVLLHDFYFVRRAHTELTVEINGRHHKPDKLPMPLNGRRMYFARYSPDPLILTLNPEKNASLQVLPVENDGHAYTGNTSIELTDHATAPGIKSLSRSYKHHTVTLSFAPAFPNLKELIDGEIMEGQFDVKGHSSTGKVAGVYRVEKLNGSIEISMTPSKGWIPNERSWSLRFLYSINRIFKSWPSTYTWTAVLTPEEAGEYEIASNWQRNGT